MKRFLCMIFAIMFMVNMNLVSGFAFSDVTEEGRLRDSIDRLSALGIIVGYPDGTYKPENNVTRAEFMSIIVRALGHGELISGGTAVNRFIDVPNDHWARGEIAFGSDLGIIAGYGNNLFGPEDKITYEQIAKILVHIIGYDVIAQSIGGYPAGYMTVAIQNNIMKGILKPQTSVATRGDIALMLYEAMQIETLEKTSFGSEISYKKSGTTLLDELLRMKDSAIYRGIINANHITDLNSADGESSLSEGQVAIEGVILNEGDTNISAYLGQNVEYYIKTTDDSSIPVITSFKPYKNSMLTLKGEDIIDADLSKLVYEDENQKERTVSFSSLKLVYNGKSYTGFTGNDLKPTLGQVHLVDNNNDSRYEIAFVNEYRSFMVDKVSTATGVIFIKDDTFRGLNHISLEQDNDNFNYEIVNVDGDLLALEDISSDDVITVEMDKSETNVKIIVSNASQTGAIESIYDDKVQIRGSEYTVLKREDGKYTIEFDMNKSGKYFLDAYSNVVYFKEDSSALENVAYLIQKGSYDEFSSAPFQVKVVTGNIVTPFTDDNDKPYYEVGNSNIKTLSMMDRVQINGIRKKGSEIGTALAVGDLITYKTNSSDLVTEIEILTPDAEYASRSFNSSLKSFGGKFYIDQNNTSVISIPKDMANAKEDDYYVKIELTDGSKYQIAGYEIDEKTKKAKYAVIIEDMKSDVSGSITPSTDITVVTKAGSKYLDGNTYVSFEGYRGGELINVDIASDSSTFSIAQNLSVGDVIYFSTNSMGKVDNIELVESLGNKPEGFFHEDEREGNERIYGRLDSIVRNELREETNREASEFVINITMDPFATPNQITLKQESTAMPPIYMIDTARKKVSVITLDDLYSSNEVGSAKASEIFICKKNYKLKGIILVK